MVAAEVAQRIEEGVLLPAADAAVVVVLAEVQVAQHVEALPAVLALLLLEVFVARVAAGAVVERPVQAREAALLAQILEELDSAFRTKILRLLHRVVAAPAPVLQKLEVEARNVVQLAAARGAAAGALDLQVRVQGLAAGG